MRDQFSYQMNSGSILRLRQVQLHFLLYASNICFQKGPKNLLYFGVQIYRKDTKKTDIIFIFLGTTFGNFEDL